MTERVVASLWWCTVMGFIVLGAGAGVLLCYQGVLGMLSQKFMPAITTLLAGAVLGCSAALLCRYRADLLT